MKHMEESTARAHLFARRPPPQETCRPCMGRGRMKVQVPGASVLRGGALGNWLL